jgi:hypothetical protein
MQRRRFLKVSVASGLAASPSVAARAESGKIIRCAVAGVAVNGFDVFKLRERLPIVVRRETHEGKPCYRILNQDDVTIGFVPREKLPHFEHREVKRAWLSKVNPYAVPWKQLEIAIFLT